MTNSGKPVVDIYLFATGAGGHTWWSTRLQSSQSYKLFGGPFDNPSLLAALNWGMAHALARLNKPCLVRLHAPPLFTVPDRHGEHLLEHVPEPSQGLVYDDLRQLIGLLPELTANVAGREDLATLYATSLEAVAAWLAIAVSDNRTNVQVISGSVPTSPRRLALLALANCMQLLPDAPMPIDLVTESDYVLQGQQGLYRWANSQWTTSTGQPLQNADLWQGIHEKIVNRRKVWSRMSQNLAKQLHYWLTARRTHEGAN